MKNKLKAQFPLLLKSLVVLLTFWFIYREINTPGSYVKWHSLVLTIRQNGGLLSFSLVLAMMLMNWAIEAFKWKYICHKIQYISYTTAVCSLLAGLNLAIFTPARIGEYGGRVMYLNPSNRAKGSVGMLVGALSQMLVTNIVGLAGLLFFMHRYFPMTLLLESLLVGAALLLAVLFVLFYFHVHLFNTLLLKSEFLRKFENSLMVLRLYSAPELLKIVLLSFFRYIVFSHQYIVLLLVLNGSAPYLMCLAAVSLIFMVQSLIPTFALADLGVRGASAAYFLGFVIGPSGSIAILAAAFGVWLINIILPAVIGLYFVLKLNFTVVRTT